MKAITLIYIGLVTCYEAWVVMETYEWERRFYGNKRYREFSRDGKRLIKATLLMTLVLAGIGVITM